MMFGFFLGQSKLAGLHSLNSKSADLDPAKRVVIRKYNKHNVWIIF